MNEKEFSKLIKKDRYQIFLFESSLSFPFNLFSHHWFICSEKGKISRWEILFRRNKNKKMGHLYKDFLPPIYGIEIIPFYQKFFWKGKIKGIFEGNKNSQAKKMINFIKKSNENYPYKYEYHFISGPNSNTFAQWVIDKFPKCKFKLSWKSIGKNYS